MNLNFINFIICEKNTEKSISIQTYDEKNYLNEKSEFKKKITLFDVEKSNNKQNNNIKLSKKGKNIEFSVNGNPVKTISFDYIYPQKNLALIKNSDGECFVNKKGKLKFEKCNKSNKNQQFVISDNKKEEDSDDISKNSNETEEEESEKAFSRSESDSVDSEESSQISAKSSLKKSSFFDKNKGEKIKSKLYGGKTTTSKLNRDETDEPNYLNETAKILESLTKNISELQDIKKQGYRDNIRNPKLFTDDKYKYEESPGRYISGYDDSEYEENPRDKDKKVRPKLKRKYSEHKHDNDREMEYQRPSKQKFLDTDFINYNNEKVERFLNEDIDLRTEDFQNLLENLKTFSNQLTENKNQFVNQIQSTANNFLKKINDALTYNESIIKRIDSLMKQSYPQSQQYPIQSPFPLNGQDQRPGIQLPFQ